MDPEPTARRVFWFHRPDTLEWQIEDHVNHRGGTLRARLPAMPTLELDPSRLRRAQFEAVTNLERSLKDNRGRALLQMATGSGKTFAAANICPLARAELDDFVACYRPRRRRHREETQRFRRFGYDELVARDKASLDIFWLRDESLEDTDHLPAPGVIAAEIVEDLQAALAEFTELAESLQGIGVDLEAEE
jgi:hypothetical protein